MQIRLSWKQPLLLISSLEIAYSNSLRSQILLINLLLETQQQDRQYQILNSITLLLNLYLSYLLFFLLSLFISVLLCHLSFPFGCILNFIIPHSVHLQLLSQASHPTAKHWQKKSIKVISVFISKSAASVSNPTITTHHHHHHGSLTTHTYVNKSVWAQLCFLGHRIP